MERLKVNIAKQVKRRIVENSKKTPSQEAEYSGVADTMISTGSTLLDLAISGGRVRGGGIPAGILVEVFGPNSAGKTVLLCELAGAVQRKGGEVMFHDPEARLNQQFARMFDLDTSQMAYHTPHTITDMFSSIRKWQPANGKVNGIFADSLAALSTDLEMDNEEGDKMGMRRAKEFSEELRKTCRILAKENHLMVCSNQIRESGEAYGQKYKSPGGMAIGFYSSLRLKAGNPEKIKQIEKISGKEVTRIIGVKTEIEVFKSSVWKPYRTAPLIILFDYGIDDVRANLQFIKSHTNSTVYSVEGEKLSNSIEEAIKLVEEGKLIKKLQKQTIDLWEEIEAKFHIERKTKER